MPARFTGEFTFISEKGKYVSKASSNLSILISIPSKPAFYFQLRFGVISTFFTLRYFVLTILRVIGMFQFSMMSYSNFRGLIFCLFWPYSVSLSNIYLGFLSGSLLGMTSMMKSKKTSSLPSAGELDSMQRTLYPAPLGIPILEGSD